MQPESTLTLEEIQKARQYKAEGLKTQEIMARIARERLGAGQMRMTEQTAQPQGNVFGRVLRDIPGDIKETAQNVQATSERFGQAREAIPGAEASLTSKGAAAIGSPFFQTLAMGGDVAFGAAKAFSTPEFEKTVGDKFDTATAPIGAGYQKFTQGLDPQAQFTLGNIVEPTASAVLDVGVPGTGAALTRPIFRGLSDAVKATPTPTPLRVPSIVQTGITPEAKSAIVEAYNRSIKPNFNQLTTPQKQFKYQNDVNTSLASIVANKQNLSFVDETTGEVVTGRTPQNLKEYTEAIQQTERDIFQEYNTLAEQAGEVGAFVDNIRVANSLNEVINSKRLKVSSPETIRYAQELKDTLLRTPKLSIVEAQDIIADFNNQLAAFYSKATPDAFSQTMVKAQVANQLRQAIDDSIGAIDGAPYQTIKAEYGALKNIERDVMRAYLRDARRNTKGLIDFTDVFSGGQVISGILSFNPASIAQGVAQKAIATGIKALNDPNRAVKKMFEQMERYAPPPRAPRTQTRKALPAPAEGALRSEVGSGQAINMPERDKIMGVAERGQENIKQPTRSGEFKQQASRFKTKETFLAAVNNNPRWKAKMEAAGITPEEVAKLVFAGGATAAVIVLMLDDENISPLQFGMMGAIAATPTGRKVFTDKLAKTVKEADALEMERFIDATRSGGIKAGGEGLQFKTSADEALFDSVMTKVSNMPVLSDASIKQLTDVFEEVLQKRKTGTPDSPKGKGETPQTTALLEEAPKYTNKEMNFVRNTKKAFLGEDQDFAQNIEPAGQYMNVGFDEFPGGKGMEKGTVTFKKPLVLDWKTSRTGGWKTDLSNMYGGKTGKDLSQAIIDDGYDGIIAVTGNNPKEAVNLQTFRGAKPTASSALLEEAKKYKNTLNLQDKDDLEELGRIFGRDQIEDMKNGKMTNWRGDSYEDLARVNIISETPLTAAQKLDGKIKPYKLENPVVYHGTSADVASSILKEGFKKGTQLPDDAYRGGGYGASQDSISFSTDPMISANFTGSATRGIVFRTRLSEKAKIVTVDGFDYAEDLNDFIKELRKQKVDAVYLPAEKEVVVINPKVIERIEDSREFDTFGKGRDVLKGL